MKKSLFSVLAALSVSAFAVSQQVESQVYRMFPHTKVVAINTSPYYGMYEVFAGHNSFYIESGNESQVLVGHILNISTMQDETQARLESVLSANINFKDLPLKNALKVGNGPTKLAVFIDPDCPYCQRLESWINANQSKLTVYYFFMPLAMHPNALPHTKQILCAANPGKAIFQVMIEHAEFDSGSTECQQKVVETVTANSKLAQDYNVTGTPYIITSANQTIDGFNQPALDKFIEGAK